MQLNLRTSLLDELANSEDDLFIVKLGAQCYENELHNEFIQRLKLIRLKNLQAKKILREILVLFIFLFTMYEVAYLNKDKNSFQYMKTLKNLFINNEKYQKVNLVLFKTF